MFTQNCKKILAVASALVTYKTSCQQITKTSDKGFQQYVQVRQFNANFPIQDRFCVFPLKRYKSIVCSVFDGHGGDLCAQYASTHLQEYLNARIQLNFKKTDTPRLNAMKSLQQAYDDIQNGFKAIFLKNLNDDRYLKVGSCGLTAIVFPDFTVVGNSGDCEGVFLGGSKIVKTNQRLNAGQPSQQQRLKKQFPLQDDIFKCIKNTNYCYVKGRLQPTRSFGDFYLKSPEHNFTNLQVFTGPYITHKPKISWFRHEQFKAKTLVLATDGLWDEMDENKMNEILKLYHGTDLIASRLFEHAMRHVLQRNKVRNIENLLKIPNRRNLHDDITILTVDLEKFKKIMIPFSK